MAHGNDLGSKRYFWLRLERGFFKDIRIKKLRKMPGGDTLAIIYLKLMLLSIEQGGVLIYERVYDSFEEEMAVKIDEEENLDSVKATIIYLSNQGMLQEINDGDGYLPQAVALTGSETYNNIYKRSKKEALQGSVVGKIPTQVQPSSNQIPTEKESEINIYIKENHSLSECQKKSVPDGTAPKRFVKPTVEEIANYCVERGNNVDSQKFFDYYESNGWKVGRNSMKDWKASVRSWERNGYGNGTRKVETDNGESWMETLAKL